jgi:hypothetical protein
VQNRAEIWNELTGISPIVAQINSKNVYKLPEWYFENLADEIMKRIQASEASSVNDELRALSAVISRADKQVLFNTPDGYFETFAEKLISKIKVEETDFFAKELKDVSTFLTSAGKQISFSIPDGYFENFAEKLIGRIKAEEASTVSEELESLSPLLSQLSRKTPFSIPDGYFAELSDNATTGARAVEFVNGELENLSPLMSNLKSKNVYEAPEGYFESLSVEVLSKIKQLPQQAKVISINKRNNWLRYAAAAVVIGFIATTMLFIFNNKNTNISVAKIDEKQLADSLHNANDEDILNYMQSHNIAMPDGSNSVASLDLNDDDADDMLADVSDNELQQYVDEHYGTKELTTN